jgi:hypothetical protein
MFWFIVLLLVVGAGFYFYQKLISIEREIHAEQEAYSSALQKDQKPDEKVPEMEESALETADPAPETVSTSVVVNGGEADSLEEQVCAEVNKQAGIKQTDLYLLFSATDKKQLQRLIKKLADDGRFKREKQGSSYLLYPL